MSGIDNLSNKSLETLYEITRMSYGTSQHEKGGTGHIGLLKDGRTENSRIVKFDTHRGKDSGGNANAQQCSNNLRITLGAIAKEANLPQEVLSDIRQKLQLDMNGQLLKDGDAGNKSLLDRKVTAKVVEMIGGRRIWSLAGAGTEEIKKNYSTKGVKDTSFDKVSQAVGETANAKTVKVKGDIVKRGFLLHDEMDNFAKFQTRLSEAVNKNGLGALSTDDFDKFLQKQADRYALTEKEKQEFGLKLAFKLEDCFIIDEKGRSALLSHLGISDLHIKSFTDAHKLLSNEVWPYRLKLEDLSDACGIYKRIQAVADAWTNSEEHNKADSPYKDALSGSLSRVLLVLLPQALVRARQIQPNGPISAQTWWTVLDLKGPCPRNEVRDADFYNALADRVTDDFKSVAGLTKEEVQDMMDAGSSKFVKEGGKNKKIGGPAQTNAKKFTDFIQAFSFSKLPYDLMVKSRKGDFAFSFDNYLGKCQQPNYECLKCANEMVKAGSNTTKMTPAEKDKKDKTEKNFKDAIIDNLTSGRQVGLKYSLNGTVIVTNPDLKTISEDKKDGVKQEIYKSFVGTGLTPHQLIMVATMANEFEMSLPNELGYKSDWKNTTIDIRPIEGSKDVKVTVILGCAKLTVINDIEAPTEDTGDRIYHEYIIRSDGWLEDQGLALVKKDPVAWTKSTADREMEMFAQFASEHGNRRDFYVRFAPGGRTLESAGKYNIFRGSGSKKENNDVCQRLKDCVSEHFNGQIPESVNQKMAGFNGKGEPLSAALISEIIKAVREEDLKQGGWIKQEIDRFKTKLDSLEQPLTFVKANQFLDHVDGWRKLTLKEKKAIICSLAVAWAGESSLLAELGIINENQLPQLFPGEDGPLTFGNVVRPTGLNAVAYEVLRNGTPVGYVLIASDGTVRGQLKEHVNLDIRLSREIQHISSLPDTDVDTLKDVDTLVDRVCKKYKLTEDQKLEFKIKLFLKLVYKKTKAGRQFDETALDTLFKRFNIPKDNPVVKNLMEHRDELYKLEMDLSHVWSFACKDIPQVCKVIYLAKERADELIRVDKPNDKDAFAFSCLDFLQRMLPLALVKIRQSNPNGEISLKEWVEALGLDKYGLAEQTWENCSSEDFYAALKEKVRTDYRMVQHIPDGETVNDADVIEFVELFNYDDVHYETLIQSRLGLRKELSAYDFLSAEKDVGLGVDGSITDGSSEELNGFEKALLGKFCSSRLVGMKFLVNKKDVFTTVDLSKVKENEKRTILNTFKATNLTSKQLGTLSVVVNDVDITLPNTFGYSHEPKYSRIEVESLTGDEIRGDEDVRVRVVMGCAMQRPVGPSNKQVIPVDSGCRVVHEYILHPDGTRDSVITRLVSERPQNEVEVEMFSNFPLEMQKIQEMQREDKKEVKKLSVVFVQLSQNKQWLEAADEFDAEKNEEVRKRLEKCLHDHYNGKIPKTVQDVLDHTADAKLSVQCLSEIMKIVKAADGDDLAGSTDGLDGIIVNVNDVSKKNDVGKKNVVSEEEIVLRPKKTATLTDNRTMEQSVSSNCCWFFSVINGLKASRPGSNYLKSLVSEDGHTVTFYDPNGTPVRYDLRDAKTTLDNDLNLKNKGMTVLEYVAMRHVKVYGMIPDRIVNNQKVSWTPGSFGDMEAVCKMLGLIHMPYANDKISVESKVEDFGAEIERHLNKKQIATFNMANSHYITITAIWKDPASGDYIVRIRDSQSPDLSGGADERKLSDLLACWNDAQFGEVGKASSLYFMQLPNAFDKEIGMITGLVNEIDDDGLNKELVRVEEGLDREYEAEFAKAKEYGGSLPYANHFHAESDDLLLRNQKGNRLKKKLFQEWKVSNRDLAADKAKFIDFLKTRAGKEEVASWLATGVEINAGEVLKRFVEKLVNDDYKSRMSSAALDEVAVMEIQKRITAIDQALGLNGGALGDQVEDGIVNANMEAKVKPEKSGTSPKVGNDHEKGPNPSSGVDKPRISLKDRKGFAKDTSPQGKSKLDRLLFGEIMAFCSALSVEEMELTGEAREKTMSELVSFVAATVERYGLNQNQARELKIKLVFSLEKKGVSPVEERAEVLKGLGFTGDDLKQVSGIVEQLKTASAELSNSSDLPQFALEDIPDVCSLIGSLEKTKTQMDGADKDQIFAGNCVFILMLMLPAALERIRQSNRNGRITPQEWMEALGLGVSVQDGTTWESFDSGAFYTALRNKVHDDLRTVMQLPAGMSPTEDEFNGYCTALSGCWIRYEVLLDVQQGKRTNLRESDLLTDDTQMVIGGDDTIEKSIGTMANGRHYGMWYVKDGMRVCRVGSLNRENAKLSGDPFKAFAKNGMNPRQFSTFVSMVNNVDCNMAEWFGYTRDYSHSRVEVELLENNKGEKTYKVKVVTACARRRVMNQSWGERFPVDTGKCVVCEYKLYPDGSLSRTGVNLVSDYRPKDEVELEMFSNFADENKRSANAYVRLSPNGQWLVAGGKPDETESKTIRERFSACIKSDWGLYKGNPPKDVVTALNSSMKGPLTAEGIHKVMMEIRKHAGYTSQQIKAINKPVYTRRNQKGEVVPLEYTHFARAEDGTVLCDVYTTDVKQGEPPKLPMQVAILPNGAVVSRSVYEKGVRPTPQQCDAAFRLTSGRLAKIVPRMGTPLVLGEFSQRPGSDIVECTVLCNGAHVGVVQIDPNGKIVNLMDTFRLTDAIKSILRRSPDFRKYPHFLKSLAREEASKVCRLIDRNQILQKYFLECLKDNPFGTIPSGKTSVPADSKELKRRILKFYGEIAERSCQKFIDDYVRGNNNEQTMVFAGNDKLKTGGEDVDLLTLLKEKQWSGKGLETWEEYKLKYLRGFLAQQGVAIMTNGTFGDLLNLDKSWVLSDGTDGPGVKITVNALSPDSYEIEYDDLLKVDDIYRSGAGDYSKYTLHIKPNGMQKRCKFKIRVDFRHDEGDENKNRRFEVSLVNVDKMEFDSGTYSGNDIVSIG